MKLLLALAVLTPFILSISGKPEEPHKLHRQCYTAVGVEDKKKIDDSDLSASDNKNLAKEGRLNGKKAWTTDKTDGEQWLEIELPERYLLTRVATQGDPKKKNWVKEFMVEYSENGDDWAFVENSKGEHKVFDGNKNQNGLKKNDFDGHFIIAKYVRIWPTKWENKIALRVELYGCIQTKGIHVKCTNTRMTIDISKALLKGVRPEELHLSDTKCKAVEKTVDGKKVYRLVSTLTGCGTRRRMGAYNLNYLNKVVEKAPVKGADITRVRNLVIYYSCSYNILRSQTSRSIEPDRSVQVQSEHAAGVIPITLNMFPNDKFKKQERIVRKGAPVKVKLRQTLYFKLRIYIDDPGLVMRALRCFSTPTADMESKPQHNLVKKACPVDRTVHFYPRTHNHYQTFRVSAFRYIPKKYKFVFFHCKAVVCEGKYGICAKKCGKGKRGLALREATPERTMSVTFPVPIALDEESEDEPVALAAEEMPIETAAEARIDATEN